VTSNILLSLRILTSAMMRYPLTEPVRPET